MISSDIVMLVSRSTALHLAVPLLLVGSLGSVATATSPDDEPLAEATFSEGIYCGVCHTNSGKAQAMRDGRGREIAPYDLWRSSAMANSARDPYWQAVVSVEVAATPSRKQEIEQTCNRCHAPMAGTVPTSPEGQVLAYLKQNDEKALLGMDGVSCTVCHQIRDDGLGTADSFTGRFKIGTDRRAFGPHADPYALPMKEHAGYKPVEGQQLMRSALCGTCHTLITETLNPDGSKTGHQLHEQTAYLEWRNSVYNNERDAAHEQAKSCQACHLPVTDEDGQPIRTAIARAPGGEDFAPIEPRSPFGRHILVGGNAFLAQLLRDNPEELRVFASEAAFEATIEATRRQLRTRTARISIGDVQRRGEKLRIPVHITNLAGHKLPTGFPSRRVWVRLELRDAADSLIFISGGYDAEGRITDAGGRPLGSEIAGGPVQPHYQFVASPDEVQIYESVMADKQGDVTFTLLRGAGYLKDNRLLPQGWSAEHPDAPVTAPVGIADDLDFAAGGDVVWYEVPVAPEASVTIRASLHLQSIGVRHVGEVFRFQTPEVAAFRRMYQNADRTPEILDEATKRLDAEK